MKRPQTAERQRLKARQVVWAGIMRRLKPWLLLSRVSIRELSETAASAAPIDPMFAIREPSAKELLRLAAQRADLMSPEFVKAALSRGDFCAAAFVGEDIVAWVWGALNVAPHGDGMEVAIQAPYVYGYKAYVQEQYRGARLLVPLVQLRDRLGLAKGRTHYVGFVETHNYASIKANSRLGPRGSRLVGFAGYVKLFGQAWSFHTWGLAAHTFRFQRVR